MWSSVKSILRKAVIGIPAAIVVMDNTFYVALVQGESMQPLLNPVDSAGVQDMVLLSRLQRRSFDYQRGDVVVVTSPRDPHSLLIKRIIGLAGDTVRTQSRYSAERLAVIPAGHCWIEGDHSSCSLDSNVYGPVPVGLIFSKAVAVVWPWSRWQLLPPHQYPRDRVIGKMHSIIRIDDDDDDDDYYNEDDGDC